MIKFVNRITGTTMWVADERKDEYLAAGHHLAASSSAKPISVTPVESVKIPEKETKPKTTTRKTTKKR